MHVVNLFWEVWVGLPDELLGHNWQEVLECVKLVVEEKDVGMMDPKLVAFIEGEE
jgi:hypothetical protein